MRNGMLEIEIKVNLTFSAIAHSDIVPEIEPLEVMPR